MQRIPLDPRPDWQARAESLGFTWHHEMCFVEFLSWRSRNESV